MFKKKLFKVLLTVTCFIVVILAYFLITRFEKDEKENEDVLAYVETTLSEDTIESTERHFYVDVKGEVKSPGVYFVSEGMLVIDAINLAGGLTKNAYTNNINLSLKLFDEMVILIQNKKDVTTTSTTVKDKNDALIDKGKNSEEKKNNGPVNINTASKEELMSITGIGESKANSIIEYRSKNKFETIEDIMKVSGIGEKFFEQIKNYITV